MRRIENGDTACKILEAAMEVFAEKGFRGATTREIAAKAGANVASLHYHFRDKESLYLKVLNRFIDESLSESPIPESIGESGLSPEKGLELFIDMALRRVLNRKMALAWTFFLHEMIDPSGGRDLIAERLARPHSLILRQIVARLLGKAATEEKVKLCSVSVASQILYQRIARPMVEALLPGMDFSSEKGIAKLSAHIARFSISAIKAEKEGANA